MNKKLKWILIIAGILLVILGSILAYEKYSRNDIEDKKPAIYLYPLENSFIEVKLEINGELIKDIPKYNDGWNVFVTKEGIIENEYEYLFYEAKLKKLKLPREGWIVEYMELDSWFEENLIKLGLNEKEKDQFKEYWLENLPEANYYEIRILEESFLKENMDLIVSPEPDSLIRINFYFKPLKKVKNLSEPTIITPKREGFVVVEWGGILDK